MELRNSLLRGDVKKIADQSGYSRVTVEKSLRDPNETKASLEVLSVAIEIAHKNRTEKQELLKNLRK